MLHDRCLCGNPLNEQDPDESIYCSVTCARQDALDSLSARDPRYSTSSLSSLSCPSLSGTDDSGDSEDGVWEWVTTPSPFQSSYRSHYQRVQSLRGESESGEGAFISPRSSRARRIPLSFVDNRVLEGDRSRTPCYPLRDATPVPRVPSPSPCTMSQVMESLVVKDASILDQYSCVDYLSILDAYSRDPIDDLDAHRHSNLSTHNKAYQNLPEIPPCPHAPLLSHIKNRPSSLRKSLKRPPTPVDVNASIKYESPSMRRLLDALECLSVNSSDHGSVTPPRDSHTCIERPTPSTTATSPFGPITPSDEDIVSWSLATSAAAINTSNSLRFHGDVRKPVDQKWGVVDRLRSGDVRSPPRYV